MLPYVVSDDMVTVYVDGKPTSVHVSQPNYKTVLEGIRAKDWAKVKGNLTIAHQLVNKSNGRMSIVDGEVFRDGRVLTGGVVDHILRLVDLDLPVKGEMAFLDKLMENPSSRAVREFNEFLLAAKLPITAEGNFRAYKVVRSNFTDKHSGTFDNTPGKTVEVPRNKVDDNSSNECSYGLHFCGYEYTKFFANRGDRLVEVEINPADVVAFPADHNKQKGRCSKYVVIRELAMHEDILTGTATRDYQEEEGVHQEYDGYESYNEDEQPEYSYDDTETAELMNEAYDTGYGDGWNDAIEEAESYLGSMKD